MAKRRKTYVEVLTSFISNMRAEKAEAEPDVVDGNEIELVSSSVSENAIELGDSTHVEDHALVLG